MMTTLAEHLAAVGPDRGYGSMTDAEVLADLKARTKTVYRDVPLGELAGLVELEGIYEKAAAAPDHANAQKLLRLVRGETLATVLEYSDATKRAKIDGLLDDIVAGTSITASETDMMKALGTNDTSEWAWLGHPTELDVKEAR